MAKIRALSLSIYKNPTYRGCANGGWSDYHDELYVICEDGNWEIEHDDPALFTLVCDPSPRLVPYTHKDGIGPMMGGSFAATSDSRFSRLCNRIIGQPFYGAVAIHDRYETAEEYGILSF